VTDLEREYSPSSMVGGSSAPFIADYEARSAIAAAALGSRIRTLGGGSLFVEAEPGAPLLVFVHGGYWQALSAAASLYLAPRALARGWSFAAVEYTLAPAADLPTMVGECRAVLAELARAGPGTVTLAGHSAGAHLAAMVSLVEASPLPVAHTVLVSGVYDLRPLVHTSVNDPLGMDSGAAAAVSPLLLPVQSRQRVTVAWGDRDTNAFRAQGADYAVRLRAADVDVVTLECAGRHHFDIVDDLVDPGSELGALTSVSVR
jgi:arylformamidase